MGSQNWGIDQVFWDPWYTAILLAKEVINFKGRSRDSLATILFDLVLCLTIHLGNLGNWSDDLCVFSGCFLHPILWSQDIPEIDRRMVEMQQSSRLFRIIYGHFFKPGNRNQTSITQLKRKIIFHPSSQLPSMFSFSRNFHTKKRVFFAQACSVVFHLLLPPGSIASFLGWHLVFSFESEKKKTL